MLNVLFNIFIGWIGASVGSGGCFVLVGCKYIKNKTNRLLATLLIITLMFAPTLIVGEHAALWFWSALVGLVVNAFFISMLCCTD